MVDGDPSSVLGHLNRGIAYQSTGAIGEAKRQFAQAILKEPDYELAWLWLAEVSDTLGEQRYCLDRALAINPDSVAQARRSSLLSTEPIVPPPITDVDQPPLPPSFRRRNDARRIRLIPPVTLPLARIVARRHPRGDLRKSVWRQIPGWLWGATLILVIGLIAGLLLLTPWKSPEHYYVALVAPMSGPNAAVGEEVRKGAQLAVDVLNDGNAGPDLELVVFDDQNDPAKAVGIAHQIVDDTRILAVIGHSTSTTSLAAAPIYQEAHIAAISGQATSNQLSQYTSYFRTTFSNDIEGRLLAEYSTRALGYRQTNLIVGPGAYEQEISQSFADAVAKSAPVGSTWTLSSDQREASIAQIVDGVRAAPPTSIVLMALTQADAHDVLLAIRRSGLHPHLIGVESIGSAQFANSFAQEPEEKETPGYFTEGLYVASPLIYDSIGGDSLAFARAFQQATGDEPGWRSAKVYDAVWAADAAIQQAPLSGSSERIAADRQTIIDNLHAINSRDLALRGVSGPLFFDARGNAPQGLSIGQFTGGYLVSAPLQYRLVTNPTQYDVDQEVASGHAITIEGQTFRQYRVVYVGIEMIELRDLQTTAQSFTADFFIYFRYGGDDSPVNIVFTNALESGLSLGTPLTESTNDTGEHYRLYRVQGTFSEPMSFKDYPWDKHTLTIRFQNPILTESDIVYVPDLAVNSSPQEDRLVSGFDQSRPFNRVPSWIVYSVDFSQVSITETAAEYETEGLVQYSEFRTGLSLERDVRSFLIKNLLPLLLLTIVTYSALWFPADQAGNRIKLLLTGLLTSSVMLSSLSGQLPDIGYTVAIEWGFYVYMGGVALLVLLNIAVDRSYKTKRFVQVKKLEAIIRISFPVVVIGTITAYASRFVF